MANEKPNKVIYGGNTLIDLTDDTVSANNLLAGATAHDNRGEQIQGAVSVPTELDDLSDVTITSASENDQLINKSGAWINKQLRVELTQAEYNALEAQGLIDPDVEYFISNGQLASAPIDDNDVSEQKTWSSEKINSLIHVYSTTETVIGTYLGKPLYAMQFDCTSPSNVNISTIVFSGMNSTMKMRNLYGVLYRGDGVENVIPSSASSNTLSIWRRNATDICMSITAESWTSKPCSCVVEYTKTTD